MEKKINKKNNKGKIKILVVIPHLSMGGEERIVADILKYINRDRFKIRLCLFEKKGELLKEIPPDITIFDLRKKNRWSFLLLVIRLRSIIKKYKPDIIFSALWYSTLISACSNFIFNSTPFYFIAHEPHNHKWDIKGRVFKKIKSILINWSHKKANLIVTVSKGAAYDIAKNYSLKKDKIKVINNSIDLELIEKLKLKEVSCPWFDEDNKPIIATLGRLVPRKGFHDLLEAFRLVRNQKPSRLILIGEGELKPELQKLSYRLGLGEDVLFQGYQDNPFKFICRSDIFVFSSHREGFGNVIIEAMACGIPVVSTNCPFGPDEIITDGVNGLLVPVGDINRMSEAILKLLSHEKLSKKIARAGRKRANDFMVEKMVKEHENLFCSVKLL